MSDDPEAVLFSVIAQRAGTADTEACWQETARQGIKALKESGLFGSKPDYDAACGWINHFQDRAVRTDEMNVDLWAQLNATRLDLAIAKNALEVIVAYPFSFNDPALRAIARAALARLTPEESK